MEWNGVKSSVEARCKLWSGVMEMKLEWSRGVASCGSQIC